MIHLNSVTIHSDQYPVKNEYPFNIPIFNRGGTIQFTTPVTFLIGENGTGKSTLLEALAIRCEIFIWKDDNRRRFRPGKYEDEFYRYLSTQWTNGKVYGSFFGSSYHEYFSQSLDEWAVSDPEQLGYFGGKSLQAMSHGQSLLAYFENRYRIKGLYLMDEPETALSPRSQLMLLDILERMSEQGHAQFIIATHSPILLACRGSQIFNLDGDRIVEVTYKETDYYKVFLDFLSQK